MIRPPRLAERLLRTRLAADERDELLGDLNEDYLEQVAAAGPRRARRWYWGETCRLLWQFSIHRRDLISTDHERTRGRFALEAAMTDVRYVWRTLAQEPAFALATVATFALGIGITATVFRVADRLTRPPAAVASFAELAQLEATWNHAGYALSPVRGFSYPDASAAIAAAPVGAAAASLSVGPITLGSGRDVNVRAVDANFLPLLGVTMAAGRPFETAEGRPEAGRAVCIIADDLWRREFDRRPLDDLTLTLGGRTCAVIGVTGPRFLGLELDPTDVWLPFGAPGLGTIDENGAPMPWHRSGVGRVQVLLRLPEDIARQSVIERLTAALAATDLAAGRASRTASLARVGDLPDTQPLRALRQLGVVGAIVFAIACANAMHLLLARGLRRQREIATRLALGASRARVVRLLIAEAATLAACGGAVAAVVGGSTADGLQGMLFPDARWTTAWLDGPTLIFNALATVAAGVITGATTGWLLTGSDLVGVFRSGRGLSTWRARRMRAGLLAAQTALSLALLAAAGLLGRSLIRLQAAPLGFDPEGLVSVVAGPVDGDPRQTDGTAGVLAARLRRERGVHKVALTSVPPFGAVKMAGVSVPGSPFAPEKPRDWPLVMAVSPEFFEVTRTPFLEGRTFGAGELDQPAVIVNASMAHAYWGGTPPPGACVSRDGLPCAPVIGVVADVIEMPAMSAPLRFYVPLGIGWDGPRVVVARADPAALSALPARVSSAFPILNRRGVDVASDRLTLTLRPWRTSARLFAAVAGVALLLVCIGIYGVISCGVSERMVEISLRVAFGATPSAVRRLVVGEGLKLIAAGAVVGLGAAALVGRHLESLLFSVSPYDPWVYGLALVAMIAAALGAMLPASIRASRLDAIVALRRE